MKTLVIVLVGALITTSCAASACGTPTPTMQAKVNLEESTELKKLVLAAADEADEIFIGTVIGLEHAASGTSEFGSVRLSVEETLKGPRSTVRTVQWQESVIIACKQSAMFLSVGFRPKEKFIVYVRDGKVFRSAAADHLRSGMLTLADERAIAIRASGT